MLFLLGGCHISATSISLLVQVCLSTLLSPLPFRFLWCQDRQEASCWPEGISKYRQEGLDKSGSMACGQEGCDGQRVREWPFIRMGTVQGRIREARRGWPEISRGPQRYGVYPLPSVPYMQSVLCALIYLCQSRGNPALHSHGAPECSGHTTWR